VTLQGKTALVTGGASGIGAATARRLAAEGARVAIGDLNERGAKDVAGELDGFGFALDVADAASVNAGVAAAVEALGEIDVLVNNAGTDRFAFFVNSDEQLWDFVLGVNLRGVLAVTHAVLPGMQQRRATALGRSGEPEEVAAAIVFLAGDEASYVTGQTLNVSGGLSMW
jgi:2-hydroxycyclohexanecarboxyl-CoA dehydrogenase